MTHGFWEVSWCSRISEVMEIAFAAAKRTDNTPRSDTRRLATNDERLLYNTPTHGPDRFLAHRSRHCSCLHAVCGVLPRSFDCRSGRRQNLLSYMASGGAPRPGFATRRLFHDTVGR